MIVAAAALLNMASKWAQKSRQGQARSINDLEEEEEETVDGVEDEFEDEPKHYPSDIIVGEGEGEGNVEIVEMQ